MICMKILLKINKHIKHIHIKDKNKKNEMLFWVREMLIS